MSKPAKKKPARPAAAAAEAAKSGVTSALHAAGTRPADAGKPSASIGGKSASSKKGR